MKLTTSQCTLRPWRLTDAEQLAALANNPRVSYYLRECFPFPYHLSDARNYLNRTVGATPLNNWAIEVDGRAAGSVGCVAGTDIERCSAELGYWLGEPYWGRGIVAEAVSAIVSHLFETRPYTRIWAGAFACNVASRRVLEKCGFELECVRRQSVIKHGQHYDQAIYVLIRDDFLARRATKNEVQQRKLPDLVE